jgi:hypothetical protein
MSTAFGIALGIVLGLMLAILFIFLGWVLPIWLGIRAAKRNNRSALWMWFGIHPIGGWIAFAVLHSLPPLKVCSQCAEKVKAHAKICPFCMTTFEEPTSPQDPTHASR